MLFADSPDFVTQLTAAWPTYVVATPILAAAIASVTLQVQARLAAAKKAAIDALAAEKAHEAVLIAQQAGRAAAAAARDAGLAVEAAEQVGNAAALAAIDAKNAAAVAHSAVTRSVRTLDEVRKTAERLATERAAVDKQTSDKLDGLANVARATHVLVNNEMHLALAATAVLARRIANMPGATAEDKRMADAAETKLTEHDARQDIVDRGGDET